MDRNDILSFRIMAERLSEVVDLAKSALTKGDYKTVSDELARINRIATLIGAKTYDIDPEYIKMLKALANGVETE